MEIKISSTPFGTNILNKKTLVSANDPILKQVTPKFDFNDVNINPIKLANELILCMQENNGVGLACPQIGYPYRMFIMGTGNSIVAFFNPEIISTEGEKELASEGCLTFPGLFIKIRRYKVITVSYQDYTGKKHVNRFEGLTARIFQHELDHLNGILFTDIAGKVALDIAKRKLKKQESKK